MTLPQCNPCPSSTGNEGRLVSSCLQIHRHTEEQLAAQSSALTEQETPAEPVVLRALLGLITVLSIADKSQAKALVPFVYCRARPCLESVSFLGCSLFKYCVICFCLLNLNITFVIVINWISMITVFVL